MAAKAKKREEKFILWFDEIGISDVPLVGGKNASLGEMIQNLTKKGINVPNGFAITAYAYQYLLKTAGIEQKIQDILKDLDTNDLKNLQHRGARVRDTIATAKFPKDLEKEILVAYKKLSKMYKAKDVDVAVRSSATAEDLPDASFAGQQETYLNVRGDKDIIDACKKCFASLFTDRAISYREDKGFAHFDVYLSIVIQKMVRSDSSSAGVIFSIDTESGFKDAVFITGAYGLGENVVQGSVNPDEFYVFKPLLKNKKLTPIVGKVLGEKEIKMIYTKDKRNPVRNVFVPEAERDKYVIGDDDILKLARWATQIEEHYTKEAKAAAKKAGKPLPDDYVKPMDIEWAKDGDGKKVGTGELFIVQARPETVHSQREITKIVKGKKYFHIETFQYKTSKDAKAWISKSRRSTISDYVKKNFKRLVLGRAVGSMIGQGKVNNIPSVSDIHKFEPGSILVTSMTDPDWEPIMKKAAAIVTDKGGRTCHAAIISRELGIPCIVGSLNASQKLQTDMEVTVSCVEGDDGLVYSGKVPFEIKDEWIEIPETRTKIMMNLAVPERAFDQGQIPNDGVGLARVEFIINSHIGIHPNALMDYNSLKKDIQIMDKVKNKELLGSAYRKLKDVISTIDKQAIGYKNKSEYYVDMLARGISRIAAGVYPEDVIVRMSDFKTNEYANLVGGYLYEPEESNPMIGWRGASRYYDPKFEKAFGLECKAILKVRNDMGFNNVKIMIPFCRTPNEGRLVVKACNKYGLKQGEKGLEFYVMCEIPSNVIAAEEFADIFDGFSIGSNDLTQLTLGLDRDSELVASIYDEEEDAVKRLIADVIKTAKKRKKKIGICGQGPSDRPSFAQFLVECGIDSISLNPDTVLQTKLKIAQTEKRLGIKVPKKKK